MKLKPFPSVSETVFHAFGFLRLGFDLHVVPHSGPAAALRRKARTNQMSLADYLHEELLGELVLSKPE
ncbi:MAG: hypothetical protein WB586_13380 [Chthoniobacterales bacterium]